jgi:Fe-S cluster biogenesis protein NfuA/nitrite reductase/ring-hydroxylating ferredoxin subunit
MDDAEARERVARIDQLLGDVEALADPAREIAIELVQSLVELYGEGLARVVAHLDGHAAALAGDEVVAHLLLLHGLHPVPLETRVRGALDEVAPYLGSHGGGVELIGIEDGVVRLRLEGSCSGCPSSTMTLKLAIEDAVHKAAPDVERIEAEGAVAPAPGPPLLQLEVSDAARGAADGRWAMAGAMGELPGDAPVVRDVAGETVLFVRLGRGAYAYRPACPHCGSSLATGTLNGARLTCEPCGHRYDVRHAGRCLEAEELHMEPVPLLVDAAGAIKVALGAAA